MSKEINKLASKFRHILHKTAQQIDLDNAAKIFQNLSHIAYTYAQQVKNKQLIPGQLTMHLKEEVVQPAFAQYQNHLITKEQYEAISQYVQYYIDHADEMADDNITQAPQTPQSATTENKSPQSVNVHSVPNAAPSKQQAPKPIAFRDDVKSAQEMLNKYRSKIVSDLQSKKVNPKFTVDLNLDGKLGPKTREALADYKQWMGMASLTDEQAIDGLNVKKEQDLRGNGLDPDTGTYSVVSKITSENSLMKSAAKFNQLSFYFSK